MLTAGAGEEKGEKDDEAMQNNDNNKEKQHPIPKIRKQIKEFQT